MSSSEQPIPKHSRARGNHSSRGNGQAGARAEAAASSAFAEGVPPLPDEQPVTVIRDSLYDRIPLGAAERALIGSAPFLRLQDVKQLGFVYRIWPGATHSRYEHSLGVYYLALRALRSLLARGKDGGLAEASATDLRVILAAALLHDIGHYPFSHAIEELGHPIISHEKVGRSIIERSPVAGLLERDCGVSPGRVADLIDPPRGAALPGSDALLVRLLSGALDVDKLDYLPRDARACNVPYGGVDVSRLLGALRVADVHGQQRLVVTHKGISALNSLLHARQEMFDNVYWHHTNRAMMAMLLRAVQDALVEEQVRPTDLPGHDDHSLLALLAEERMPASTRALVAALRLRRPYKSVLEVSMRAGSLFNRLDALFWDQGRRRRVEMALAAGLAEGLGRPVAPHEALIDIPKPEKWEMEVWVTTAQPPLGMQPLMTWVEATGQLPADLSKYEQHQRRIRVVAAEAIAADARARRDDLLAPLLERALA
ncbi:MAG TPA: HD domain-containing protein [Ktedonobacterales bacterium]